MLHLIYGLPSTGKTHFVLNKIKELSDAEKPTVLIVPEQSSFQAEKAVLQKVGDKAMLNSTVLSFDRLFDEVGRKSGGICGNILNDAQKIVFMHRALNYVKDDLILWKKYTSSISFAKTMLDTVGEFKINGITYTDILNKAQNISSGFLKNKLLDIARIYEEYDNFLKEKFIDPVDKLTKLSLMLEKSDYFCGKTVFIDSFKDFSGQQYRILKHILSQADDLYITFTFNPTKNTKYGIYTNVSKNIENLKTLAASRNVVFEEYTLTEADIKHKSTDLENLEKLLSGENIQLESCEDIKITKLPSIFDEADFVASKIRELAIRENYCFKDFVIICRDADVYKEAVASACEKNEVPLFYDNRLPLSSFPLSVAVDSLFSSLEFSSDAILRFHKTGLGTLNTEEITTLENYIYLWNIDHELWDKDWDMNVKGFVKEEITKTSSDDISRINNLRQKALEPILFFREKIGNSAYSVAKSIFDVFEKYNFAKKLNELREQFKNEEILYSETLIEQSFQDYIAVLDSLVSCFGNKSITTEEFYSALKLAVTSTTVGTVPQHLDEVSFGSADRIRASSPKITFIIGANQGVFPKNAFSNGIFSVAERDKIIKSGLLISDNSISTAINENFLVYTNLCSATKKLYITYALKSISGVNLQPSAFVLKIKDGLSIKEDDLFSSENSYINSPQTVKAAISTFCKLINSDKKTAFAIKEALDSEGYFELTESLLSAGDGSDKLISAETAQKLYGKNITMSATKFDTFNHCPFSFFCRYGLGIQKPQRAEFDVLQKGLIVHFVLEKFITQNGENLKNITDNETDILVDRYINDYLDSVQGYRTTEDNLSRYLVSLISRSLKDVAKHIRDELNQSEFVPVGCEVKIGENIGEINVTFPLRDGKIQLRGSIDRVDKCGDFIRIVDYKTGSKKFHLSDILVGLNLQMLIYLYAITKGRGIDDNFAAGILYQPAKRDIKEKGLAMNGLLTNNVDVLKSMENTQQGEYIPKFTITQKSGQIYKKQTSFVPQETFSLIFDLIEKKMTECGERILQGDISVYPTDGLGDDDACKYCDFKAICNYNQPKNKKAQTFSNDKIIEKLKAGEY